MDPERKTVLVLDDEPQIREVLELYLRREGFEPACCGTVAEAARALESSRPNLMLLDITLPDGSGLDVLRAASNGAERIPAIMLTARADEVDRVVGLELGADDYVVKPFSPREVIARVRAVLRRFEEADRRAKLPERASELTTIGALSIDFRAHEVRVNGRPAKLTPAEFRILGVLATHPGQAFTRAHLLEALDDDGTIYERTLDRHINNLRKKIEPDPANPTYVQTVFGVGYKMRRD